MNAGASGRVMGRPDEEQRAGIGAILSDRRVMTVVLVVFIVMAGAGLVLPILPLFARSFGVGYGAVGLLAASGLVADRLGLAGPLLLNAVVVALAALLWLA